MRIRVLILLCLALMAAAGPAFAQAANPYDLSWAALDPGNDWAAQVIRFIFPIPGTAPGTPTGNEATVIQLIVGQFTGFVAAIACAFVVYTTIINVHRAAETSRILGNNQSWIFVVRLGFAAIMMFPLAGGFSTGQYLVMQGALTGVGMAKTLYTNAIKAVGPDGMVIAQPMIPGTQAIVAGLIDSELCMDLVNLATNTTNAASGPMVPIPQPVSGGDAGIGDGFTVFRYALSAGNATGTPVCGSVSLLTPKTNQQTIAGVSIDMAAIQQAVLSNVLNGSIRNQVAVIALNLWTDKTAAALVPLQAVFTNATNAYAATLTTTATAIAAQLNAALQAQAQAARNGGIGLLQGEVQQDTLGWTGAGAYYLEIALMNASTLSLLQATPTPTAPTYEGLGMALSYDLAPLVAAQKSFMDTLNTVVQTRDGTTTPNGVPHTLASAKDDAQGKSILDRVLGQLNITNGVLSTLTGYLMPNAQIWTDPFGGLINLGQTLINTALAALGLAAVLASTTASTGLAMWNAMTFNWGAAAATVAGHAVMNFLGVPVFLGPARPSLAGHHDRLRAAAHPLGHLDGRRHGLDHPGLRGDDRRAAVDAGAHDNRRRGAARPRHRRLEPAVQRGVPAHPHGDRPVPRLLRVRLHVLADPRDLRHRRRLRVAARLAGQQPHRPRCHDEHLRDDSGGGRDHVVPDGRPAAAPPAQADRLHLRQPGRRRRLPATRCLGSRRGRRRRGGGGDSKGC